MAKILYGVSGEGSGHSSRAKIIAEHLIEQGHEVKIATYDRGIANLKDHFDVIEICGLSIETKDNKIDKSRTFSRNLQILPEAQKKMNILRKIAIKEFQPDCVITDFEPQTAYLANYYDLPLLTLDNQHRLRYLDFKYPPHLIADAILTENIIRAMVPRPDFSIFTAFYEGKITNKRSYQTPPLIRNEILNLQPTNGNVILVYLTKGFDSLKETLKKYKREKFVLYGYHEPHQEGNIQFKPFNNDEFLKDLANCKAVIATAGFTLMTEAFYLGKPYFATPMIGQFEQEYNGYMMEKIGFGRSMEKMDETKISAFLYEIPDYREKLKHHRHVGNEIVFNKLDQLLEHDLKLLKSHHAKRSITHKLESVFDFLDI